MMKNEELIKALNKCGLRCLEDYLYGCIGCPLYGDNRCDARIKCLAADALEETENRIEELEAQLPKWVSVKDRLPELGQEVLVYAIGKDDGFIGDAVTTISERFIFRLFPSSDGVEEWRSPWQYFDSNYEITHWMPLPEPPKGEQNE